MGNGSAFIAGRFDSYVAVKVIAGVKVITKVHKKKNEVDNTPIHSHTPNTMYARMDKNGKVVQIAVYENNKKTKDIEWGHNHAPFKKGEVHVQDYINDVRQIIPRNPTEDELRLANKIMEGDNG